VVSSLTAYRGWLISLTAGGPQNHRLAADDAVSTHLPATSTWIFRNPEVSGSRALADEKDDKRERRQRRADVRFRLEAAAAPPARV
jgi:hypothetical protein